jgi:hypothetical protein
MDLWVSDCCPSFWRFRSSFRWPMRCGYRLIRFGYRPRSREVLARTRRAGSWTIKRILCTFRMSPLVDRVRTNNSLYFQFTNIYRIFWKTSSFSLTLARRTYGWTPPSSRSNLQTFSNRSSCRTCMATSRILQAPSRLQTSSSTDSRFPAKRSRTPLSRRTIMSVQLD